MVARTFPADTSRKHTITRSQTSAYSQQYMVRYNAISYRGNKCSTIRRWIKLLAQHYLESSHGDLQTRDAEIDPTETQTYRRMDKALHEQHLCQTTQTSMVPVCRDVYRRRRFNSCPFVPSVCAQLRA